MIKLFKETKATLGLIKKDAMEIAKGVKEGAQSLSGKIKYYKEENQKMERKAKEYMAQGMSKEEAYERTFEELYFETAEEAIAQNNLI